MRKLLFLTMIALLSVGTLSAQNRVLRDAQRAWRNNDFNEARTLARQAAEHPETANNPALWKLKGDIGNAIFDAQVTRAMMGQDVNERVMYDGLFESFAPYVKADSLGQLPDARGRVRNPVRRDIASIMRANHQHFINGGAFFSNAGNHSRAADFFEMFWNIPTLPMFEDARDPIPMDSTFQVIKYFAAISALQANEDRRAIAMLNRIANEPFIENSDFTLSDVYELLASTYFQVGDSVRHVEVLRRGAEKFPTNDFFIRNLINESIMRGEIQQALANIDAAIANAAAPADAAELITIRGALLAEQGDMEAAIVEYRRALALDPNNEIALEALARQYIVQAQDIREATAFSPRAQQIEADQEILALFQLSLPLLETLERVQRERSAPREEFNTTLMLLRIVYYNLTMLGVNKSAQLEAVESQLPAEFL